MTSLADVLIGRLAIRAFDDLAQLFEPSIEMQALLPHGLRVCSGASEVIDAFVGWFSGAEDYAVVEASVDQIGPRLQLQYRIRVHGGSFGDRSYIVEQQLYVDVAPTGRIKRLSMLCSGFARQPDPVPT